MKKVNNKEKLDQLVNSTIDDIEEMSDNEILQLATDTFGGLEQVVLKFNSIVKKAEGTVRVSNFEDAKKKLEANQSHTHSAKIIHLPLDQKKNILEMVQRNKLITTLAARNATDYEADIDTMLEDLVDLGVIDENGNPL